MSFHHRVPTPILGPETCTPSFGLAWVRQGAGNQTLARSPPHHPCATGRTGLFVTVTNKPDEGVSNIARIQQR